MNAAATQQELELVRLSGVSVALQRSMSDAERREWLTALVAAYPSRFEHVEIDLDWYECFHCMRVVRETGERRIVRNVADPTEMLVLTCGHLTFGYSEDKRAEPTS